MAFVDGCPLMFTHHAVPGGRPPSVKVTEHFAHGPGGLITSE